MNRKEKLERSGSSLFSILFFDLLAIRSQKDFPRCFVVRVEQDHERDII